MPGEKHNTVIEPKTLPPFGMMTFLVLPFFAGHTPDVWRDHVFMELEFSKPDNPTGVAIGLKLVPPIVAAFLQCLRRKKRVDSPGKINLTGTTSLEVLL